jgi:hypothetical protein
MPWKRIGLGDVEDPKLSRQSADRCQCDSYTLAALYSPETLFSTSGTHFRYRLSKPQGIVRSEGLGKLEKSLTSLGLTPVTFRLVA